jgi:hypothetical protein
MTLTKLFKSCVKATRVLVARFVRSTRQASVCAAAVVAIGLTSAVSAQTTCPFFSKQNSLTSEGLFLLRYALGLRDESLVSGTGLSPQYVETLRAHIACPNCGFHITGAVDAASKPQFTVNDAVIAARAMAGMTGTGLTVGLTITSATRTSPTEIINFVDSGCGLPQAVCANAMNFCVRSVSSTTAIATWSEVSGAVDYDISINGRLVQSMEESQRKFRAIELVPGVNHTYALVAKRFDGSTIESTSIALSQPSGSTDLTARDLPPWGEPLARSMNKFGWVPTLPWDTCTKPLHDSFWTYGPDNKIYPTWHPPVYEYTNGDRCYFGHEHGQDQRASNLYGTIGAMPFGYVNEQLRPDDVNLQRNEDHYGHKVAMFNGISERITNPSGGGEIDGPMKCDILFKLHQGTYSPDALKNNAHERFLNYRCPNGVEIRYKGLQGFGAPNSFVSQPPNGDYGEISSAGATPPPCLTSADSAAFPPYCQQNGENRRVIPSLQLAANTFQQFGGRRYSNPYPCDGCAGNAAYQAEMVSAGIYVDLGSIGFSEDYYIPNGNGESWQGGPQLLNAGVQFSLGGGPYWNLANPARYYDPSSAASTPSSPNYLISRQIDLCYQPGSTHYAGPDCKLARTRSATPIDWKDPRSPFKGALRFNETNFVDAWNPPAWRHRFFVDWYGQYELVSYPGGSPSGRAFDLPTVRSARNPIRVYVKTGANRINFKLANFAGKNQCGGSACFVDFNFHRLRTGELIDAKIHAPN